MSNSAQDRARLLAFLVPAALLGGAYISQFAFGLFPCEMCWWQRYAHFAALALAALAFALKPARWPIALAGLAILFAGLIGLYHAGVEYKWWIGLTRCTSLVGQSGDPLADIMSAPTIRCDEAQWTLFGLSLAGYNFLISTLGALAIFALLRRSRTVSA